MMHQGKITKWNDAKGFGFITPASGGREVFVHVTAFPGGTGRPQPGATVSYELSQDEKGRPRADNAVLHGQKRIYATFMAGLASVVFLSAIALLAYAGQLPRLMPWLYLGMSVLTLFFYAMDKSAARKGQWREAESTLHFLALLGGWPGALLAQQLLRHKSRKLSFLIIFWLTIGLNMAALFYLLSPEGAELMTRLRAAGLS